MKEPRRLRHESKSPIERMLLDTAAAYRRPPTTRSKTLTALGLAGSAALSAGAAQGAWASMLAKVGGAKALAAIAVIGAAVTVPAVYYGARLRTAPAVAASVMAPRAPGVVNEVPPPPMPESMPAARPVAPPEALPSLAVSPVPRERRSRGGSNHVRPARKDVPPAAATTAAPPPASPNELGAEVGAIEAARGRLAKGDPAATLALLDDYASAFPDGRLQPEAMVLRIDALAKTGRSAEARRVAEMFLQRYPKSVLAARVRGHLSD